MVCNQFRQNLYSLVGILIGLFFGTFIFPILEKGCVSSDLLHKLTDNDNVMSDEFTPKINLAAKPLKAQKSPQKLLRPRYFSTELGIRKKLFVAVLTTQQSINTRGIAVNKTTSHLVDKLIFFIDAPGTQKLNVSYLKLSGIVRFIDTRVVWKPFHVLKYIKDNFIENYDFFFIVNDSAYIKAKKLNDIVQKISISQDVYASTKIQDSVYCSLNAGILFSNSVIQNMVNNIDWCVKNIISSSDDLNFGQCVLHSSNTPCQQMVQDHRFFSYYLQNEDKLDFNVLQLNETNDAVTIYPVKNTRIFYTLHAYFSKIELDITNSQISSLRASIIDMSQFTPDGSKSVTWPVGNQPGNKAPTRFDVLRWNYFTESHVYLSSDFDNVRMLNEAEKQDIEIVINASVKIILSKYGGIFQYHSLINGYYRFDPSRGMDYKLDLAFYNTKSHKLGQKRIEVCKPLGKVEMLQMPYVTENRRVNILLPVRVADRAIVDIFLQKYKSVCLEKKEKTFLMLVLIYEYNAPGKGMKDDVFKDLKNQAVSLTKMYAKDDNRIAWLSIKLQFSDNQAMREAFLNFAIADLTLKKFTADSLILFASPNMEIKIEYLNRVRMNTILEWQVFSPIPFSEYNPVVYGIKQQYIDVNKNYGHFDTYNMFHISFYVKDYFATRRKTDRLVPLVKSDSDIRLFKAQTFDKDNFTSLAVNTIYSMFVRYGDVHVLRATEPALLLKFQELDCNPFQTILDSTVAELHQQCLLARNSNLGSRSQLSKLLLEYQEANQINLTFIN